MFILVGMLTYGAGIVRAETPVSPSTSTVIITLRHTLPDETDVDARSISMRRQQIRLLQDDLVTRQLAGARDIWRMQTMPVIVARIDEAIFAQLQQDPAVLSVRASRLFTHSTSESSAQIGARAAHATGVTGAGTSVAVIDTGVDANHVALRGQIIQEACFSTTDESYGSQSVCADGASMQVGVGSGQPCDLSIDACNHGTHVAGIIAGHVLTRDGITTRGIAPGAKIIAIQVFSRFDASHTSAMCGAAATDCVFAFEHDLLRALDWLQLTYDRRVWGTLAAVNISLGDGTYSEPCDAFGVVPDYPFKWFIDQLRNSGVATVVSAGNGASNSGVSFPACVSSAISVGSVASTKPVFGLRDRPSTFSNVPQASANLPNAQGDRLLDFYAPGEAIRSSVASGGANTFAEYSGTSMAAPHVAGAWALIKSIQPVASVSQVYRWLYDTGVPIFEQREGFDAALVVPRIDIIRAMTEIRNRQSPVVMSAWAIEMGDVRAGATARQRLSITFRSRPTTIRWTLSGRYYRIQPVSCAGFVDDLTPSCVFDVIYVPPSAAAGAIHTASIRLQLNSTAYTLGISGRSVVDMPDVALTQTADQYATTNSLLTRTATPTAWPTPTSHSSARTVIAIATRTQRRRNDINQTAIQHAELLGQTATHIVGMGGATYTPSPLPRATRTRTAVPITQTIAVARTATQRVVMRQTITAVLAATRTQRASNQATAVAVAIQQTATHIYTAGLPTFTSTPRARMTRTATATRTATITNTIRPTRIPTQAYILTHNAQLYKSYRALIDSTSGAYSILLSVGDPSKMRVPELTLLNPSQRQFVATVRLPGVDATAITAVVNQPNQFVVAGRLNWDSMYVQVYDVRPTSFVLRATHIYPLAPGAQVTALYATDRRVFVGLATVTAPATRPTGQLVVFERISNTSMIDVPVVSNTLAGVPTVIRAADDSDDLIVTAGYVPEAKASTGFIQAIKWRGNRYEPFSASLRSVPITDLVWHAVLKGVTRVHLLFAAQTHGLAVLQLDESNGAIAQYQSPLPIVASKLDRQADQIAVIGFDTVRRVTVTSVYQWSIDRLFLRRTITHANRNGGIVGVALSQLHLLFADTAWLRFAR